MTTQTQVSTELSRVVLIANRKGGVLKSSLCRNIAAVCASSGYKVLVLDGDPQGNVSHVDFGAKEESDRGRGLALALQYGMPLEPVTVDGVDLIFGGPELQGAMAAATAVDDVKLEANFRASLAALCGSRGYDLVLIDSGPGDTRLMDAYLQTARWLLIPTAGDEASLDGVERTGARYASVKRTGAQIELLGAVLTKVNPRATGRNKEIRAELSEALGSAGTLFEAMIRYSDAASLDARRHGMSARQVASETVEQRKNRLAQLRQTGKGSPSGGDWWSTSKSAAPALATDYEELTREILTAISTREGSA